MGKLSLLDHRDVIEMTTADIILVVVDLCASTVCDSVNTHSVYLACPVHKPAHCLETRHQRSLQTWPTAQFAPG